MAVSNNPGRTPLGVFQESNLTPISFYAGAFTRDAGLESIYADDLGSNNGHVYISRYGQVLDNYPGGAWASAITDYNNNPTYLNHMGADYHKIGFYHGYFWDGINYYIYYANGFIVSVFDYDQLRNGDLTLRIKCQWNQNSSSGLCIHRYYTGPPNWWQYSMIDVNHTLNIYYFDWDSSWDCFDENDINYDGVDAAKAATSYSKTMDQETYDTFIDIDLGIKKSDVSGFDKLAIALKAEPVSYSRAYQYEYYRAIPYHNYYYKYITLSAA